MSTAAETDDQQQQRPEAAHRRRGREALSPAVTASGSPHPRPCRARRGEWTESRGAGTGGVQASSPPLLSLLPHSFLRLLLLGCVGALKHSCSAECRAEEEEGKEEKAKGEKKENKVRSHFPPTTLVLFSQLPRVLGALAGSAVRLFL